MNSMSREMAVAEFKRWAFDIKRIKARLVEVRDTEEPEQMPDGAPIVKSQTQRVTDESAEKIVQNFMDGTFTMDPDGNITQKLAFPIGEGGRITEITYKPRLTGAETDGMKRFDSDSGKTRALLGVMSGQPAAIIGKMDTTDVIVGGLLVPFYFLG